MGSVYWYRLCEADRQAFGHSGEWMPIDAEKILDTPAGRLEMWERQAGGYPIEMTLAEVNRGVMSAKACRMFVWIGRKQNGDCGLKTDDGKPETYDAFNPRTLRIEMQGPQDDPPAAEPVEVEGEQPAGDPLPMAGEPDPAPTT
jgi:hypothetical protein